MHVVQVGFSEINVSSRSTAQGVKSLHGTIQHGVGRILVLV